MRDRVARRIDEAITSVDAPRKIAVFDFDNTCIYGDIGELYSHFLIEEMGYRYDLDAFWDLIDPRDGRDRIRALVDELAPLSPEERAASEAYEEYMAEMGAIYGRKLVREGKAACYAWAVRLHVGMSIHEMMRGSQEAFERERNTPIRTEERRTKRGDWARVQRGIRPLVEMRQIAAKLRDAGFETWVVSATNEWTVRRVAPALGFDPERVIGNRVAVEDDRLTAALVEPALFREGKVGVIEREIGALPHIAFGDSDTDYDMLCAASELAVVIDRGNEVMAKAASERGWAVQPQSELTFQDVREA